MSSSDSSGSDSESDEHDKLETVVAANLQGKWRHSLGLFMKVVEDQVTFTADGAQYQLIPEGNTIMCDGWRAVPQQSDNSRIVWTKEGTRCIWTFEGEIEEQAEEPEVDASNIVTTKRRRAKVDYKKENEKMDNEDRNGQGRPDYFSPQRKKYKSLDDDSDSDVAPPVRRPPSVAERRPKTQAPRPAPAPKRPPVQPATAEDIKRFHAALTAPTPPSTDSIITMLARMAVFNMDLQTLKATKIGKPVNKLRRHADPRVAKAALGRVKAWKSLVPS